jgi:hypothetical protein
MIERLTATLDTVDRLDKHHGHLLNWYDTQTLQPLRPAYVSTVDSGNLAGHLLTLRAGLLAAGRHGAASSNACWPACATRWTCWRDSLGRAAARCARLRAWRRCWRPTSRGPPPEPSAWAAAVAELRDCGRARGKWPADPVIDAVLPRSEDTAEPRRDTETRRWTRALLWPVRRRTWPKCRPCHPARHEGTGRRGPPPGR